MDSGRASINIFKSQNDILHYFVNTYDSSKYFITRSFIDSPS